jgi:hypothetical protein
MTNTTQLNEGVNGYVALKLMPEDAKLVTERLQELGVKNAILPEKLHLTILYTHADVKEKPALAPEAIHITFAKGGARIMGQPPYKALVLELDAYSAVQRNHELCTILGVEHSHAEYIPHLSLKYGATAGDLDRVADAFNGMALRFNGEYIEDTI